MAGEVSAKDIIELYENGKHRRYGLLFSVNGGALVIGKLIVSGTGPEKLALGGLKLWMLGLAMAVFSAAMTYDMWQFGERMKKHDGDLFGVAGKRVLGLIGGMLVALGLIVSAP